MGLKIRMHTVDGEKRVDPLLMRLLCDFAHHRDRCQFCFQYYKTEVGDYCSVGKTIVEEIRKHPDAQFFQDPKS